MRTLLSFSRAPHDDCTDTGTLTSFDWPSATVIVVVPDIAGVTENEALPVCVTAAIDVSALDAVKPPLWLGSLARRVWGEQPEGGPDHCSDAGEVVKMKLRYAPTLPALVSNHMFPSGPLARLATPPPGG